MSQESHPRPGPPLYESSDYPAVWRKPNQQVYNKSTSSNEMLSLPTAGVMNLVSTTVKPADLNYFSDDEIHSKYFMCTVGELERAWDILP